MEIALTPEMEKLVDDEVASGRYPSAGEVVRDALRLFQRWSEAREQESGILRREIQVGLGQLARGESVEYDEDTLPQLVEDVQARGLERLRALRAPSSGD